MLLLAIPLGFLIGMIVGAVGGGGALLALPVLVYVLGEGVGPASTASLVVVAVAAAVGAGALALRGHVEWRFALAFSAPAALGSLLGALANTAVSPRLLVLAFVPVMLLAAAATWRRAAWGGENERHRPDSSFRKIAAAGVAVGVLTGFFGVGGGFMIVPVLTLWFGMGFARAVATSLVIITLTGLVALSGHLVAGAAPHLGVTVALAAGTAAGALAGTVVARRLPQATLGRAFAVILTIVALLLLIDVVALGGPPAA